MAIRLNTADKPDTLEVQLRGKLTHPDYQAFVPRVEQMIQQHGKIRLLVEMIDFHGWEGAALWDDFKFDLKHFSDILRIAMVGETKWEKGMSLFCQPFTAAKIRYFDISRIAEARQWLQEN